MKLNRVRVYNVIPVNTRCLTDYLSRFLSAAQRESLQKPFIRLDNMINEIVFVLADEKDRLFPIKYII